MDPAHGSVKTAHDVVPFVGVVVDVSFMGLP